jgi:hypothetical protein
MDDGWKSRKLWTAVFAMSLIVAGFVLCKDRNAVFGDYVAGILTAAGLFKAANLVEKLKGPRPPVPPT